MSATLTSQRNAALRDLPVREVAPWVRPTAWLELPSVVGQQRFAGLHRIDAEGNYVALLCRGAYTVDWGDGTTTNHADNTVASKLYSYSSIPDTGESTLGYRQVVIQVYPQAGQNITTFTLARRHPDVSSHGHNQGWLDIAINFPSVTTLEIGGTSYAPRLLERAWIGQHSLTSLSGVGNGLFRACSRLQSVYIASTTGVTSFGAMFAGCSSLREIPWMDTSSGTNFTLFAIGCSSLVKVAAINTSAATTMTNMFSNCVSLRSIPRLNTSNVTNMASMFSSCTSLESVPPMDTSKNTSFNSTFSTCTSLASVPALDLTACTDTGQMFSGCTRLRSVPPLDISKTTLVNIMFQGCTNLETAPLTLAPTGSTPLTNSANMFNACTSLVRIPAINLINFPSLANFAASCVSLIACDAINIHQTVTFANCKLSAAAINTIFGNLTSGGSGKTITVTGNPGAATCNTSIATAKGWTVVA